MDCAQQSTVADASAVAPLSAFDTVTIKQERIESKHPQHSSMIGSSDMTSHHGSGAGDQRPTGRNQKDKRENRKPGQNERRYHTVHQNVNE